MPSSTTSIITPEEIANGWKTGEGYDYYYSGNSKKPLKPAFAWKNIGYWWENTHKNPDGQITQWKPKSKPVWFTEFGFPSIDKASNQPNIFFDPKCIDGGVPKHSSGVVDFSIQRKAIRAFIEYWKTQEYIGQMFLWTWDARPYPAWPHMKVWRDGNLWEKGHWVNNKFGASSIASIILEISHKCGIDINNIEVSSIDEAVEGFVLSNQITALNAINILRSSHFFDISACDGELIAFRKRGHKKEININSSECLKLTDNSFVEEVAIPKEMTLSKIDFYFMNQHKEYSTCYLYINNEEYSSANTARIRLPIAMTIEEAGNIGQLILQSALIEDKIIRFKLSNQELRLKPADFIFFKHNNVQYSVRVISIEINRLELIIISVVDNRNIYFSKPTHTNLNLEYDFNSSSELITLDLPFEITQANTPYLAVYLKNNSKAPLYTKRINDLGDDWNHITNLNPTNAVGKLDTVS